MNQRENIIKLKKQFLIDNRQLSLILGISILRIEALLKGAIPSRYEFVKIERGLKIKKMITKPMSIVEIIQEQHTTIEGTKKRILDIAHIGLGAMRCQEMSDYIDDMIDEAMYLGMLYANNNDDEEVLKQVRKRRMK